MVCQGENCESERGVPFVIFRKDATAEKKVFCADCVQEFRAAHKEEISNREVILNVFFSTPDYRLTMKEFSGQPARQQRL
jgi:hypothetical protein